MKQRKQEVILKEGQAVWVDTVGRQDSDGRILVNKLDNGSFDISGFINPLDKYNTMSDLIPMTKDEIVYFIIEHMKWVEDSTDFYTKTDGDAVFYISFENNKWILNNAAFTDVDGECADGYWETTEDIEETILVLQECKIIITALNCLK
jgi:hypothetical protein